jgi:hypothetical protein
VAVTGCTTPDDESRSAAAGFDLHLLKPVDPAVLVRLLSRFRRVLYGPADPSPAGFGARPVGCPVLMTAGAT